MAEYEFLLSLVLYAIPIGLMFFMGFEIILRDRSILNRISSVLFVSMGFLFVGSFLISIATPPYVPILFKIFMLLPSFGLISSAVHFTLRLTSRHDSWSGFKVFCVCYLQTLPALVLLVPTNAKVQVVTLGAVQYAQPDLFYFLLIIIPGIYTCSACTYFIIRSSQYVKQMAMAQKQEQLRVILYAVLIGGTVDIGLSGFNYLFRFTDRFSYPEPSMLGIIFFAILIRYAITKYEFLPSVQHKYMILYKSSPISILLVNASGQVVESNPAAHKLFGDQTISQRNVPLSEILKPYTGADTAQVDRTKLRVTVNPSTAHQCIVQFETEKITSGGEHYEFLMLWDITDNIHTENQITYMANHDSLTKLANRRYYLQGLQACLQELKPGANQTVAVVLLDLDRFKQINDTKGHHAGDLLLLHVADLLRVSCYDALRIARLGGDEFALLYQGTYTEADLVMVGKRIIEQFRTPFVYEQEEYYVTASLGIHMSSEPLVQEDLFMQYADLAMYEAKRKGRNQYVFYTEELKQIQEERIFLEGKLREAITNGDLTLHYQPQIELATGQINGAEALVRWIDKDGRVISPADFIPLAEESGLIVPLGLWVLRSTCNYGRSWLDRGNPPLTFSINVSNRELINPHWLYEVEQILEDTQFPSHLLLVEITESVSTSTEDYVKRTLQKLRDKGIQLSIDDFGTGYSTFSSLQSRYFQQLKIDRSIIKDICKDRVAKQIVTAMVTMAHSLELEVVAEGVEEQEQQELLQKLGCNAVQGYLYSRPLPGEPFDRWVKENSHPIPQPPPQAKK